MYSIGQMSQQTGVKIPTIRYYEQQHLVKAFGRTQGNQRRYDKDGLDRLGFIKHARDLGLSIEAIRELITLSADKDVDCAAAHRIASRHLTQIRERVAMLTRLETELERIASACSSGTIGTCMVLAALTDHDLCTGDH